MTTQYDADYFTDMAAVEAQERKRQREMDGPEEDSRYFIDGYDGDDFPDEDLGHGDWCEGDPDEYDGE